MGSSAYGEKKGFFMRNMLKKIILMAAVCTSVGLSACLPDSSDPDKSTSAGQMSGTFYANGLGGVALAIQNAIVTSADWFSTVTNGEINLAALNISSQGLGTTIKSYICPAASGPGVDQLTWLDSRDGTGKFAVRGIGADGGTIVGALRNRVSGNQIGMFSGGSDITMVDGSTYTLPSGCGGATIPVGAPVLVFKIERPAAPTAELARTEYRTTSCGTDATGRQMRGTLVQSRIIRYMPNGLLSEGAWSSDANSMGQCMNDVVVEVTQRDFLSGQATVDMNNFAAIALRALLQDQLQMDCTASAVRGDMMKRSERFSKSKAINTCPLLGSMGSTTTITENDAGDNSDTKILDCKGMTAIIIREYPNLYGNGIRNTVWTSGTATLVRTLDNRAVDTKGQAKRYEWLGTDVTCGGYQTFSVGCDKIPGNPAVTNRISGSKWNQTDVMGWRVRRAWLSKVFGVCWIGSCTTITGGTVTALNPDYFTGIDILQDRGTYSVRNMGINQQNKWVDNKKFIPNAIPTSIWSIYDNQCLWRQRTMVQNCPFVYDPSRQGSWGMTQISASNARPVALDPGIPTSGNEIGNIYAATRQEGLLTAQVLLNWKKCNIKGCDHWNETFGPGTEAYIKAWDGIPVNDTVTLTGEQVAIRDQMCSDANYQLNAYNIMMEKQGIKTNMQNIMNGRQQERDILQNQMNQAASYRDQAWTDYNNQWNDYNYHINSMNYWFDQMNHAFDNYSYMSQANNDYYYWYYGQTCVSNGNMKGSSTTCTMNGQNQAYQEPYSSYDIDNAYWGAMNYYTQSEANGMAHQNAAQNIANNLQYYADLYNARQQVVDSLQPGLNNANNVFNQAQATYNQANQVYIVAKDINDQHIVAPLTPDEVNGIGTFLNTTCASSTGVLDVDSQLTYKQTCEMYYSNPSPFAKVPSIGQFCNTTFERRNGVLEFNIPSPLLSGLNIRTTLLNRDGVNLAWRPQLEGNQYAGATTYLNTRQRGFTDPLMCGRSEYTYIQHPVIQYYYQCGGKGGCRTASTATSCTIISSTAREWQGLSYETGTWSAPQTVCITPWGTYGDCSQVPNPMPTWQKDCVLPGDG